MTQAVAPLAAILMVNGSRNPKHGAWYRLCIEAIEKHTTYPNHHVFVWNNAISDEAALDYLESRSNVTLVHADASARLAHPHASALDALYRIALDRRPEYVVLIDSDAHPIRSGWLTHLVDSLDGDTVLAGVWRDELSAAIPPYVHPSCLCTTAGYIDSLGLPLDYFAQDTPGTRHDALSYLSEEAEARGLEMHRLNRSNRRNAHRIIGGIYGDWIYHHGAGSRPHISFWDDDGSVATALTNARAATVTESLLFRAYRDYIAWLRGEECSSEVAQTLEDVQTYRPSRPRIAFTSGKRAAAAARASLGRRLKRTAHARTDQELSTRWPT